MSVISRPAITVAAVVEVNDRFLLVEEMTSRGLRLNQPAGHLEAGESILEAVARETLEEAAYAFTPSHFLGVYRSPSNTPGHGGYVRLAFIGSVGLSLETPLDSGIIRVCWLKREEIQPHQCRSPLVLQTIDDYLRGIRFPLSALVDLD